MNKLLRKIGAVVFSIGSAAVWAATPLAVWDGDFTSATQGDFSITATNGNTIADTSITIAKDATGGVVFTGPNSSLNCISQNSVGQIRRNVRRARIWHGRRKPPARVLQGAFMRL